MRSILLAATLGVLASGCQPTAPTATSPATDAAASQPPLDTARKRASYMVGVDLARDLKPIRDEIDLALVEQALRDALEGRPSRLDAAQLERTREAFTAHLRTRSEAQQAREAADNLREGEAFLADNAKREGVQRTASGLQYQVLVAGRGARPKADDTVRVNYVGRHLDGREFENTYAVDHPAELALGQVMPGWREALTLMPVGSKYRIWLPSKLAYGDRGVPGTIEPNSTLVFEIELLAVAGAPGG
jgi:FKBP-type peptidyl-prolyl cis-trans isomerase FkpA/FKBP-type peptidyl-prolyl cis-trans isomerase FklB